MASQLEMLMEQDAGLVVPGDPPSFASIYADPGAAADATASWTKIITTGLGRWVDLELMSRYSSGANQTPRIAGGQTAGTVGMNAAGMAPWLLVGGVLLVGFLLLRK